MKPILFRYSKIQTQRHHETNQVVKKHILVIEDEASIADNITYALTTEGFHTSWVNVAQQGLNIIKEQDIDLIILDIGLPDINGFEVCKIIRKTSDIPIIFLTARGEEIDRIIGLEIGGDDYVVKPFSPRELVARVKVILKRQTQNYQPQINLKQVFTLNEEKRQITYFSNQLVLTTYEYGILVQLLRQPERVFNRSQLMSAVWSSPEESFDRAVDTHIKTLRAKLRIINPEHNPLTTHRGVGYSIKVDIRES